MNTIQIQKIPRVSNRLFTSYEHKSLEFKNRFVMAPMTRARAGAGRVPTDLMAEYYAQRASAGLIIAEASQVSRQGTGYIDTPGMYTAEQAEGWKKVTNAVHAQGSKIFAQLWHVGRMSHTSFQVDGAAPVAPSAIQAEGFVMGANGPLESSVPQELTVAGIADVVQQFVEAAKLARSAGFDGLEIHAASGYLLEQFMYSGSNHRTDRYGGSIDNRLRFVFEIVDAVRNIWPSELIGVRIAPQVHTNGVSDPDSLKVADALTRGLNEREIGFLHVGDLLTGHPMLPDGQKIETRYAPQLRKLFNGTLIANGGFTRETAEEAVESFADLISFGVPFIANPDLPIRMEQGRSLNEHRREYFYGGDAKGYTDYPIWQDTLEGQLEGVTARFHANMPPDKLEEMQGIMNEILNSGIEQSSLKVGDRVPDFELPDHNGDMINLESLLREGPVILNFYRGSWCPYCNLELREFQKRLPDIQRLGARMIAISPELPDFTTMTSQESELEFPVLSDVGLHIASKFGLVYELDKKLVPMYKKFGINLLKYNGDESYKLPVPATFVISKEGVITFAYASADHSKRAEPAKVIAVLKELFSPEPPWER